MKAFIIKLLFIFMPLLFMYVSCIQDETGLNNSNGGTTGSVIATFGVQLPAQTRDPITHKLTDIDENFISTIDVLAFRVDENDSNKEYFAYLAEAKNITDDGGISKKKFEVTLQKHPTNKYRFVIIANARSIIATLEQTVGTDKENMLARLIMNNQGKWNTDTKDPNYKPMPMWAESSQMSVTDVTTSIPGLKFIRMTARIDVVVDAPTQETFKLSSVRLYNYNENGMVTPNTGVAYWDGSMVLSPTLPASPDKKLGPLVYDQLSTPNVASAQDIYLFESAKTEEWTSATCLVIGGKYSDQTNDTYYRVDLTRKDGNGDLIHLDILRNYYYRINIARVDGAGYATPEDAFNAQSAGMESEVVIWNEGLISDVVFDGQYTLGVSSNLMEFPQKGSLALGSDKSKFTVFTDNPNGWSIEKIVDDNGNFVNWIYPNLYVGEANVLKTVNLNVQENLDNTLRIANIYLKAGRLTLIVQIIQTEHMTIELRIKGVDNKEITELAFMDKHEGSLNHQNFTVEWYPQNASCEVTITPIGSLPFEFSTVEGGDVISNTTLNGGSSNFSIQPPAFTIDEQSDPFFYRKMSKVDFTVSDGSNVITKSLILKQYFPFAFFNIDPAMNGQEKAFTKDGSIQHVELLTSTDWELRVYDPGKVIAQLYTKEGISMSHIEPILPTKIYFKTINDLDKFQNYEDEVIFSIVNKSTQEEIYSYPLRFLSAQKMTSKANSYLVKPGKSGILIPISRVNDSALGTQLFDNEGVKADLLWTDNPLGLNASSNVQTVESFGGGETGYIHIRPGSAEGNALVVVNIEHNPIYYWSWHIWVTNFTLPENPVSGTFMDRNLGALSNSNTTAQVFQRSTGLYYQWGRKDPLFRGNAYGPTGSPISINIGTIIWGLLETIRNPTTMLPVQQPSLGQWGGSSGANSWNNQTSNYKTVYDPCPPGWRIPKTMSTLTSPSFSVTGTSGTNLGRVNASQGGLYPAGGYIGNSGMLNYSLVGYYWNTDRPQTGAAASFSFNNSSVTPSTNAWITYPYSVRCVAE